MNTAIYTLTSPLHDKAAIEASSRAFLEKLNLSPQMLAGDDYSTYGSHALDLIYVRTGGTEGQFRDLLPRLVEQNRRPFYLLTSGESNSLAASIEILSHLREKGARGEILHGLPEFVSRRIQLLAQAGEVRMKLAGCRLGVIGAPSDWLIASQVDRPAVHNQLGIEIIDISMQELLREIETAPEVTASKKMTELAQTGKVSAALPMALRIHSALKRIVERHRLSGFTLRCFDLLSAVQNTGCLALAMLNAEVIVASCEGDVPALLSMTIAGAMLGVSGFQANPSRINPDSGLILLAHCTIPLNMVSSYELDTHFESGIGVGIRGYMPLGPVTVFKANGDLSLHFVAEGQLIGNKRSNDLCRTQLLIRIDDTDSCNYFLTHPIGNHHIVVTGHHGQLLDQWCNSL